METHNAFTKQQPIQDAGNFVIVNSELHCKFDKFKKTEIPTQVSFTEANPFRVSFFPTYFVSIILIICV